jgi:hypothetical protein
VQEVIQPLLYPLLFHRGVGDYPVEIYIRCSRGSPPLIYILILHIGVGGCLIII